MTSDRNKPYEDGYVQIISKPCMNELKNKMGKSGAVIRRPDTICGANRSSSSSGSSADDSKYDSDNEEECLGYVSDIGEVAESSPSLNHSADV